MLQTLSQALPKPLTSHSQGLGTAGLLSGPWTQTPSPRSCGHKISKDLRGLKGSQGIARGSKGLQGISWNPKEFRRLFGNSKVFIGSPGKFRNDKLSWKISRAPKKFQRISRRPKVLPGIPKQIPRILINSLGFHWNPGNQNKFPWTPMNYMGLT